MTILAPETIQNYLAHTKRGLGIREIARAQNVEPSTISRQVKKVEDSRDDPVIDLMLNRLEMGCEHLTKPQITKGPSFLALRNLAAKNAFLAFSPKLPDAVVMHISPSEQEQTRVAKLDRLGLEAFMFHGFIQPHPAGLSERASIVKYVISSEGRAFLNYEIGDPQSVAPTDLKKLQDPGERARKLLESPIRGLSRRKTPTGGKYITDTHIRAADKLLEDYELSKSGSIQSKEFFEKALWFVGEDDELSTVVLAVCCELKGLEQVEKDNHWPARSGKILLKAGLTRLVRYYATLVSEESSMIGAHEV